MDVGTPGKLIDASEFRDEVDFFLGFFPAEVYLHYGLLPYMAE